MCPRGGVPTFLRQISYTPHKCCVKNSIPPKMVHPPPKVKNQNALLCIFLVFLAVYGSFVNLHHPKPLVKFCPPP